MKLFFLLFISILLSLSNVFAISKTDSFEVLLQTKLPVKEKIDALKQLAYLKRAEISKANDILKKAEIIAIQNDLQDKLCETYIMYAKINHLESDINEERHALNKAMVLSKKLKNRLYEAQTNFQFGAFYNALEIRDSSTAYLLKSLSIANEINDSLLVADVYLLLATQYQKLNLNTQAIEYYEKAATYFKELGNRTSEIITLWSANDLVKQMYNVEKQIVYVNRMLEIKSNLFKSNDPMDVFHSNIFMSYAQDLSEKQQIEELQRALLIANKKNQLYIKNLILQMLATLNEKLGNDRTAIRQAEEAYLLSRSMDNVQNQMLTSRFLYQINEKVKNYKNALNYYEQFISLNDSMQKVKHLEDFTALKYKYEASEKGKQIALLENDNLKSEASIVKMEKQLQQRNGLIVIFGLLIALLFFAVRYFSLRSKANKSLAEKNEEIHKRKIEELKKEEQIKYMNAMIEGQEAERTRVASELHDGLGSLLSTASRYLHQEEASNDNIRIRKASMMINEAYNEARNISHNLMPGALIRFGLVHAIREMTENIKQTTTLEVHFVEANLPDRLDKTTESMIFRIIQECVNNVLKHANANELTIQLLNNSNVLHLTIEDDGVGFNQNLVNIKRGIGMKSIQSRVNYLNGTLNIHSETNLGTTIDILIPIDKSISVAKHSN